MANKSGSSTFKNFIISAYKDVDCKQAVKPTSKPMKAFDSSKLSYKFSFNPNTLIVQQANLFNILQPAGYSGINPKYIATKPKKISVELVIDPGAEPDFMYSTSTGMPTKESDLTLADRIGIFEEIVGYESTTHRPHYLLLSWGETINIKTTMNEYRIIYGRFDENGEPTRATIKAEFMEVISAKAMLTKQGRQSPDVSHMIEVEIGDTLPNLCEKIYGDKKYCIEIAQLNGLKSLRNIEIGDKLYFPPLK